MFCLIILDVLRMLFEREYGFLFYYGLLLGVGQLKLLVFVDVNIFAFVSSLVAFCIYRGYFILY